MKMMDLVDKIEHLLDMDKVNLVTLQARHIKVLIISMI